VALLAGKMAGVLLLLVGAVILFPHLLGMKTLAADALMKA
jgi:hypothetical protein